MVTKREPALWGRAIQLPPVPCLWIKAVSVASSWGDHGPLLTLALSQQGALPMEIEERKRERERLQREGCHGWKLFVKWDKIQNFLSVFLLGLVCGTCELLLYKLYINTIFGKKVSFLYLKKIKCYFTSSVWRIDLGWDRFRLTLT